MGAPSAPMRNILIGGTALDAYTGETDTGVTTVSAGLLVHRSTAAGADNQIDLCGANYGDAIGTEESIYSVMIRPTHKNLPNEYDITNVYPAGASLLLHRLHVGDKLWVKTSGTIAATDEDDVLYCAANGLVCLPPATATVDIYNVHAFKPLHENAQNVTWIEVEYVGVRAADAS